MVKEKNKTVTPRLAFPFCLKTVEKQGIFEKKWNCDFTILKFHKSSQKLFQNVYKVILKLLLAFIDF